MSKDHHVRADHYVLLGEGEIGPGGLALQVHRHLLEVCAECQEAWRLLGEAQDGFRDRLMEVDWAGAPARSGQSLPPPHHQAAHSWEARRLEDEIREIRQVRSAASKSGSELLNLSPRRRATRVGRAWTRFQSRAEAEYLLEKARESIREDPLESENLAATAILILRQIPGAAGTAWATEMEALATAWRANALRVAGDLPAADEIFILLRRTLAKAPLDDAGIVGEVASLEASLRIDQRRFGQAHELLQLAHDVATIAGNGALELRVLIQKANLQGVEGRPEEALVCYERAAATLETLAVGEAHRLAILSGRVLTLCDLGRFPDARDLLESHLDLFEASDQLFTGATLRHHRGRIAAGLGRTDEAVRLFSDAHRGYLTLDRTYDAALVTLDLAQALAASGRPGQLRSVARRLVLQFRSRQVGRETVAALNLLVQAIQADNLTAQLIDDLRKRLRVTALYGPDRSESTADRRD